MERQTLSALALCLALALSGCAAKNAANNPAVGSDRVYTQVGMEISRTVSQMSDTLYQTMYRRIKGENDSAPREPYEKPAPVTFPKVAVTSFVDTDTYEDAGYLGRELGELFIHELDRRGIPVHEFKITGNISVTQTGEIVFSRNWRKIAARAMVKHVLAGTITRNQDGVVLVGRVINMQDNTVIGSTTGFIPYSNLPWCYRTAEKNCTLYGAAGDRNRRGKATDTVVGHDYTRYLKSQINSGAYPAAGATSAPLYAGSGLGKGGTYHNSSQKSDEQVIHDALLKDPLLYEKYYPRGSKLSGTSTGTYDDFLYETSQEKGYASRCTFDKSCVSPVIYPATSYEYKDEMVRDVHKQSQYSRMRER